MTDRDAFEAWWDTTSTNSNPATYKGWEESCRQAWQAACAWQRESDAKVCEKNILREAGYGGRFEGYGAFDDWMTGKECADKIRSGG